MPLWPAALPQIPLVDGYAETPADAVQRTENEGGVAQTWLRYSAVAVDVEAPLLLTLAQTNILDEFHQVECARGAIRFDWRHPRKGTAASLRFRKPFGYSKSRGWWRTVLPLEILPAIAAYQEVRLVRERPDRVRPCVPANADLPEIAGGLLCLSSGVVRYEAAGNPEGVFVDMPMTAGLGESSKFHAYIRRVWATGTTGAYALLY